MGLELTAEQKWGKWLAFSNKMRLDFAAYYLVKRVGLQLEPLAEVAKIDDGSNDRRRQLKHALQQKPEVGTNADILRKMDNAWRQARYRKNITKKDKKIGLYSLSKKAKKQLLKLSKNNRLTVHEMMEQLIEQAAEPLKRIGELNEKRLDGMAPQALKTNSSPDFLQPNALIAARYPELIDEPGVAPREYMPSEIEQIEVNILAHWSDFFSAAIAHDQ